MSEFKDCKKVAIQVWYGPVIDTHEDEIWGSQHQGCPETEHFYVQFEHFNMTHSQHKYDDNIIYNLELC